MHANEVSTRRTGPTVLIALGVFVAVVVIAQAQHRPAVPSGDLWSVVGTVMAGLVCPVEPSPLPSACAPRPLAGAVVVASDAEQGEVARATTAADGGYRITIYGFGTFTLTALTVGGVERPPGPVTVTLDPPGGTKRVDLESDTGIR